MINVSSAAASKITELLAEEQKLNSGLRVFVQGGGCSGFQYGSDDRRERRRRRPGVRVERRASCSSIRSASGTSRAPRSISSTPSPAAASPSRTRTPRPPAAAAHRSRPKRAAATTATATKRFRVQCRVRASLTTNPEREPGLGIRSAHAFHRCRTRAPGRRQALQQARLHRQRVPPPGGAPQRRRPRRSDPQGRSRHQPGHRLPHPAVDDGRRDRPQGRFRRRPVPLRALVPASAALPSHLQDLQPVVRVSQLRHRSADRRGRGGAKVRRQAERRADLRHLRGVPDRPPDRSRRAAPPR